MFHWLQNYLLAFIFHSLSQLHNLSFSLSLIVYLSLSIYLLSISFFPLYLSISPFLSLSQKTRNMQNMQKQNNFLQCYCLCLFNRLWCKIFFSFLFFVKDLLTSPKTIIFTMQRFSNLFANMERYVLNVRKKIMF